MHLAARRAAEFGVEIAGSVQFNLPVAMARKDRIVKGIISGIYDALDKRKDSIRFLRSPATFVNAHEVETGDDRVIFNKAIIATGARAGIPPVPGLEEVGFITNREALALTRMPESLIVIGGGYVGIELAQMYSRFGSHVVLLGRNRQLTPGEEPDLARRLAAYLKKEGLEVHTSATVTQVEQRDGLKVVTAHIKGASQQFSAEQILVAAGRVPNTTGLGLENAGVEVTKRGAIVVDAQLRTSMPHIFAIGDVCGGYMFTHRATYDGPIAALNAVKDSGRETDYRVLPRAVFSVPTLAAVGLTESEALARGHQIRVGKAQAVGGRSNALGDTRGMLKVILEEDTNVILGFHILAPHADDLIHEAVVAMHDHGTIERISKSIHVHPTLSELVKSVAKAAR